MGGGGAVAGDGSVDGRTLSGAVGGCLGGGVAGVT